MKKRRVTTQLRNALALANGPYRRLMNGSDELTLFEVIVVEITTASLLASVIT